MKRLSISLTILFILGGGLLYGDAMTLIDFTQIAKDTTIGTKELNSATMIDFSSSAGASYTEEEKREMRVSLTLDEWEVQLASSARTVENVRYSMTREVPSKRFGNVLGARIHFPIGDFNSWALIKPPFEIPAYQRPTKVDNGDVVELTDDEISQLNQQQGFSPGDVGYISKTGKFDGVGVVKNVGVIKAFSVNVYGSNFPHGLSLRIKNQDGRVQDIFMGHLDHDGWKELVWQNPNYITEVRNRELRKYPLYPQASPFIKLIGLVLNRDSEALGGDFVVYFKDIKMVFDKASITLERDIEDEEVWGILEQVEASRRAAEFERVGNIQVLRFLEDKKMAIERMEKDGTISIEE